MTWPNLPQLSTAVLGWSQSMYIGVVCKYQEDYKTVETVLTDYYRAVKQPLSVKQLDIKPEGQRGWKWLQLHSEPKLQLQLDDIIILDGGDRYRVMGRKDYSEYGYVEYELVKGFEKL